MDDMQKGRVDEQENVKQLREAVDGMTEVEQPSNALGLAIAAHFGVDPEKLVAFVVSAEYGDDEGLHLSSAWSLTASPWQLRSYAAELAKQLAAL